MAFGNPAWVELVEAVEAKGANCVEDPERWSPGEDENGHTPLPSADEAALMCFDCPLLGKECRKYAYSLSRHVGVLDGRVYDSWGDQPMIEELEDDDEYGYMA